MTLTKFIGWFLIGGAFGAATFIEYANFHIMTQHQMLIVFLPYWCGALVTLIAGTALVRRET